jgi:hypothetical protein
MRALAAREHARFDRNSGNEGHARMHEREAELHEWAARRHDEAVAIHRRVAALANAWAPAGPRARPGG